VALGLRSGGGLTGHSTMFLTSEVNKNEGEKEDTHTLSCLFYTPPVPAYLRAASVNNCLQQTSIKERGGRERREKEDAQISVAYPTLL